MVPFRGRCRRLVVSSILFLSYFTTARKKALWSQRWANALNFRNEKSSLDTDGPQAMRDRSSKDYNDNSKIDMILKKRKKKRGRAIGSSWNGIKCIRIQVQYFRFIFCFCQLYTPTENAVASFMITSVDAALLASSRVGLCNASLGFPPWRRCGAFLLPGCQVQRHAVSGGNWYRRHHCSLIEWLSSNVPYYVAVINDVGVHQVMSLLPVSAGTSRGKRSTPTLFALFIEARVSIVPHDSIYKLLKAMPRLCAYFQPHLG